MKDTKGRLIPTVIAQVIGEEALSDLNAHSRDDENRVLALIAQAPDQTQRERAAHLGWTMRNGQPYQMRVLRAERGLMDAKLIAKTRTGLELTEKGKKELKKLGVSDGT